MKTMSNHDHVRVLWTVWRFRDLRGETITSVRRAEPQDLMTQHTYQQVLGQASAVSPKDALAAVTGGQGV